MAGDEDQRLKPRGDGREEYEEMEDQAARLPEDVLAAILRRVPPRWIAASRCVCRAWRDAVDGRRLLRADLLPLSLAGLFVHFNEHKFPEFFARPSSSAVSGDLSFLPSVSPHCGYFWEQDCVDFDDYNIKDHCNGLLLLSGNYVVNPATRRWHTLPTCPHESVTGGGVSYSTYLVYDPMVSPYYEVFNIPTLSAYHCRGEVHPSMEESEWPQSHCKMYVFSSKSGYWEEKYFVREGDAVGALREMEECFGRFNAVYFRGALYVHCRPNFLMRISLSNNTYRVIKPPIDATEHYCPYQIVRSKHGVYSVSVNKYWPRRKCWLQVWILNESCGQTKWMLKHDKNLRPLLVRRAYRRFRWILEDINYNMFRASASCPEDNKKASSGENTEWNSDEDVEEEDMVDHCYFENNKKSAVEKKMEWDSNDHNALNNGDVVEEYLSDDEEHYDHFYHSVRILGFHPYKEIVFLSAFERRCLAYHLNGSKIEELGKIYPKEYTYFKELLNEQEEIQSSPYTPCWIEEFSLNS
ncbi:uncharacterized protein [Lolium perenne]|uniref:uncharacterized protein n=1 Tax=Lolium perenne TaxID=4522 RepID=UPI0021E9FE1A|nr:uncharacterized protein LOC127304545 [Lolium perenne]